MVQNSWLNLKSQIPLYQKKGREKQMPEVQKGSSGTGYYKHHSHLRQHSPTQSSHAGNDVSNLMVAMIQLLPGTILNFLLWI